MSGPLDKAIRAWMIETFPKAFFKRKHERPLKIGILEDLQQYVREHPVPELLPDDEAVRNAVGRYVGRWGYHLSITESGLGAPRVDLDGNEVGVITASQIEWSTQRMKLLERKLAERNAADKKAREAERQRRYAESRGGTSSASTTTAERSSATS